MTANTLTELAFSKISWCDLELRTFGWTERGRDLLLTFQRPATASDESGQKRILCCHWVSNLKMDLSYGESNGGYPLTWDATLKCVSNGVWLVCFNFASTGELRFKCSGLELVSEA